jgi:hypothetical protein
MEGVPLHAYRPTYEIYAAIYSLRTSILAWYHVPPIGTALLRLGLLVFVCLFLFEIQRYVIMLYYTYTILFMIWGGSMHIVRHHAYAIACRASRILRALRPTANAYHTLPTFCNTYQS